MDRARHALFLVVERMLTAVVVPQLRAKMLGLLGATVGSNVRISEVRFFNLMDGFKNLHIEDDVHIGGGTRIDLTSRVEIGRGAVISPECLLLTHTDAGEHHGSSMTQHFPTEHLPLVIGEEAYVGARAVLLAGVVLAPRTAVAAAAVVTASTTGDELIGGIPARRLKSLEQP